MQKKILKKNRIKIDYDTPWKTVIENHFKDFMRFFFPQAYKGIDWSKPHTFLDTELAQVVRDAQLGKRFADKLVKVYKKSGDELLIFIHVEVQGYVDKDFAKRMYIYNSRIFDRYAKPVASFAILADKNKKWRPEHFGYEIWGCEVGIRFPIVKLLDYQEHWEELRTSKNPYAIIVMSHLKMLETKGNNKERKGQRKELVKSLAQRGFGRKKILELLNFIDWIMVLPKTMVEQLNLELKKEEPQMAAYISTTEQIGIEKGKNVEAKNILITLLERRFEALPKWAINKVEKANTVSLEKWTQRILDGVTLKETLA